jgi:dTDP-4-amino-4,6-dideoxygalactose transaminase
MYALQLDNQKYGKDREQLMAFLNKNNIQTRPVWFLNHLQKEFKNNQTYHIENAQILINNTLNIPCSVSLSKEDIERVIEKLNER